jgi:hypothetical protein
MRMRMMRTRSPQQPRVLLRTRARWTATHRLSSGRDHRLLHESAGSECDVSQMSRRLPQGRQRHHLHCHHYYFHCRCHYRYHHYYCYHYHHYRHCYYCCYHYQH